MMSQATSMSQPQVPAKIARILKKIENSLFHFQNSLMNGPRPTLYVPGLEDSYPIEGGSHSMYRFTCIIVVLSDIYKLLITGSHRTKRAIFYEHKQLFGDCATLDTTLNLICQLLQEPRINLNILACTKGLMMGDLILQLKDGASLDCNLSPVPVPACIDDVVDISSKAKFILIVEKDTIFQRLQDEGFCTVYQPCIMVTAKGYPDYATRQMLQSLSAALKVPMVALVDGDPYGIDIYLTYKLGSSKKLSDINVCNVDLREVQWIGVYPSEIETLKFESDHQYLVLTDGEKSKLRSLLKRKSVQDGDAFLRGQLQKMLSLGFKIELEAISSLGESYLSNVYLRSKLQTILNNL